MEIKKVVEEIQEAYQKVLSKNNHKLKICIKQENGFDQPCILIEDDILIYEGQIIQDTFFGKMGFDCWYIQCDGWIVQHEPEFEKSFTSIEGLVSWVIRYYLDQRLSNYFELKKSDAQANL